VNGVLLDASFWIALRDWREPLNGRASGLAKNLFRQRRPLVFTNLVLAETHAYFSRFPLVRLQILNEAEAGPALRWEPILRVDEVAATHLLRSQRDKTYSFCDAVSFMLMRRLKIRQVVTFDRHFRQFGEFEVIQ
jgi:uncharacterized protein